MKTKIKIMLLALLVSSTAVAKKKKKDYSKPEIYSGKELKYIGMPVNGICTGQVYLGGDGQLWNWDIFNVRFIETPWGGGHKYFVNPLTQDKRFEQGFAIQTKYKGKTQTRKLNSEGFNDIKFRGEYPIGKVSFDDKKSPVSVKLESFSPFIPTDSDNSGLPAIVMEYTIKNKTRKNVEVSIGGWIQNTSALFTGKEDMGNHVNSIKSENGLTQLICSSKAAKDKKIHQLADFGNMTLSLFGEGSADALIENNKPSESLFSSSVDNSSEVKISAKLIGGVKSDFTLKSKSEKTVKFLITWYYPNIHKWNAAPGWLNKGALRTYYSTNFKSSGDVAKYIAKTPELIKNTKEWNKTWYDSTLEPWFLDRTFINTSTLSTVACVRFNDLTDFPSNEGRFYAYEGVYLGPGTCTHVTHYEQVMGRIFPNLARQLRQQTDLGLSFRDDGAIAYRGEFSNMGHHYGTQHAIDGHAGTVMRIYREHTMSSDNSFLTYNWSRIKKAIQIMIDQDKAKTGIADGILEGPQYNTLDRTWYGKIAWISTLYAASLKAGENMATEVGDKEFAAECSEISKLAYQNISNELYNGEYFIQILDKDKLYAPNTNKGCHIDQLLGYYWANQVNLPKIVDQNKAKSAINAIVKYNFTENYGEYLKNAKIPIKRVYGDDDSKGAVMCAFPNGGADVAPGEVRNDWEKLVVGYFSEFWTGQEHHLAATLIDEGMWDKAMTIEKAIHERYAPLRRNPYNEIEYGNHYTRAMSGYAPFISASGFSYHGPKGEIGFSPKTTPAKFKSAFISAEGWGSFSQKRKGSTQENTIELKYGKLKLNKVTLDVNGDANSVSITINNKNIENKFVINNNKIEINFNSTNLSKGDILKISIKS